MSYFYVDSATTQRGKIIYRRKKHEFTACDLERLTRKARIPTTEREMRCMIAGAKNVLVFFLDKVPNVARPRINLVIELFDELSTDVDSFGGFSGGAAGGAGATGIFGLPLKP